MQQTFFQMYNFMPQSLLLKAAIKHTQEKLSVHATGRRQANQEVLQTNKTTELGIPLTRRRQYLFA